MKWGITKWCKVRRRKVRVRVTNEMKGCVMLCCEMLCYQQGVLVRIVLRGVMI